MTPDPSGSLFNLQTHTLIYVCVLWIHRDEWKLMREYLCSKGILMLNAVIKEWWQDSANQKATVAASNLVFVYIQIMRNAARYRMSTVKCTRLM